MEKILKQLGLDPKASEADAVAAIAALQDKRAETTAREKKIQVKMAAGLTRETAIMAIEHQEAEDAVRAKANKGKSKK